MLQIRCFCCGRLGCTALSDRGRACDPTYGHTVEAVNAENGNISLCILHLSMYLYIRISILKSMYIHIYIYRYTDTLSSRLRLQAVRKAVRKAVCKAVRKGVRKAACRRLSAAPDGPFRAPGSIIYHLSAAPAEIVQQRFEILSCQSFAVSRYK